MITSGWLFAAAVVVSVAVGLGVLTWLAVRAAPGY